MKKTRGFLLAAGVMLAMAFTFSCDSGGGGGGGNNPGGASGLTITGLPSGQWTVYVFAAGTDISNYDALSIITSNKVEASNYGGNSGDFSPLARADLSGSPWTGSGNRSVAIISGGAVVYRATANFTNGNATVPFSSFTLLEGSGGGGGGSSSSGGGGKSSSSGGGGGGGYTGPYGSVSHGGKTYKTVVIGTQTWMAENLNYNVAGSKCYDNDPANCTIYGRLYDWETAMEVCPSGWHLPSDDEWTILTDYVASTNDFGSLTVGTRLKATSGWYNNDGNGTDQYGFSALPGGHGRLDGSFNYVGSQGNWWSATEYEYDASNANAWNMSVFPVVIGTYGSKSSYLFSVRCVQGGGGGNPGGGSSSSGGGGNPGGNVSSCPVSDVSNNSVTCGDQTYRTVRIGEQTWFAENLNYNVAGSKCNNDLEANCNTYGRLYDWSTAMKINVSNSSLWSGSDINHQGICPTGWHLPSDAEWTTLTSYVESYNNCSDCAGELLKAASGWNDYYGASGNGTDEHDFSALPGAYGDSDGYFLDVGNQGYWWSASEVGNFNAFFRNMGYLDADVYSDHNNKSRLYSVRCVQN